MTQIVNQPVLNVYLAPITDTEVSTQACFGQCVSILDSDEKGWCKIRMGDGEEGWVPRDALIENHSYESHQNLRPTKSLLSHLYRTDDTTPSPPLMTLPFGSNVLLVDGYDPKRRWIPIELPNGKKGWIQSGDIDFQPTLKSSDEIIPFAINFLGLPYTWGGTSSYGYDCSGFIQMLFKQMGHCLPRNARDQINWSGFIPVERDKIQPGDLLFFGEGKITHVGLSIGAGKFLHANVRDGAPSIGISHLVSTNYTYTAARRLQ